MSAYCIIPENCQNFWMFVQDLPISFEQRMLLTKAKITKVEVDTSKGSWNVYMNVPERLPETLLVHARRNLCLRCGLTKVNFIQNIRSLEQYLQEEWTGFVTKVAQDNRVLKTLLTTSQVNFDGNTLNIETFAGMHAEIFTEYDVVKNIKEFIMQEFGRSCEVNIVTTAAEYEISCEDDLLTPEYIEALSGCTIAEGDKGKENPIILGRNIKDNPKPIGEVQEEDRNVVVEGEIGKYEVRELRSGNNLVAFDIVDATGGISCKMFFKEQDMEKYKKVSENIQDGILVRIKGLVQFDKFSNELVMFPDSICRKIKPERVDNAAVPRVELHLHTRMSNMDAVVSVKDMIKLASKWGHPAVAITDHGVVQAFPEAHLEATKTGIKVIYGVEGYLFDNDINHARHIILLAQNRTGLTNLYRLISLSHLKYLHRTPRIPRAILEEHREGLLFGSACEAGELIQAILRGAPDSELLDIASFYDYLEIQPVGNNEFLVRNGKVADDGALRQINMKVCELGDRLGKLVVATCDVHFLNPEDDIYRCILMTGQGYADADKQPPLYFRTTEEMLAEFAYLGNDKAYEVVVKNPRQISDLIEKIKPIPDELYSPQIPGAEDQIRVMSHQKATELYGTHLPEIVAARLKYELDAIINHGFAVLYLIAHKLVKKSLDDGYLVGSRGSVGSSFVATMTDITEVNPLPPHWRCPKCKYTEFITDGTYGSGFDLPDKDCPHCHIKAIKDGHDIPFAVFMGFNGDKVPDIDLNFSGEYQPVAHKYTEELFGKDNVFRAGTIATIAEKTAYGFVKKYFTEKGINPRNAHINKLVSGCGGVKRTTGQHPGGIMVVPRDMDIHHFTPIQYPADKTSSNTITTHFDYHSISSRLVKLDILGHDDPTVIKMLEDLIGLNAKDIPLDDPETMSIFSSTTALNLSPEQLGSTVGTFGIPEFGTKFVRQMLEDTKPQKFSELVRISGFSHGTDVWLNNAQDLIKAGTAKLAEAISARDDIMLYLIQKGVNSKLAFQTMEMVRKGKGKLIKNEDIEAILGQGVPEWYIESCKKIQYMFPKAHAVAYVMMAVRIAYCKVHYPKAFYAAYFSVRATEFDANLIVKGINALREKLNEFEQMGNDLKVKDKSMQTIFEIALEMYLRGLTFHRVDLYKSHATKFILTEDGLLPPLASLQGLGDTAAHNIISARQERPFLSLEDLRVRGRISKTVIDILKEHGCLGDLPETDQMKLFA